MRPGRYSLSDEEIAGAGAQAIRLDDGALENGREDSSTRKRFIDYVLPGVIGLILQLITATLMACMIAREREAGIADN
jgi:hypothetical protein